MVDWCILLFKKNNNWLLVLDFNQAGQVVSCFECSKCSFILLSRHISSIICKSFMLDINILSEKSLSAYYQSVSIVIVEHSILGLRNI